MMEYANALSLRNVMLYFMGDAQYIDYLKDTDRVIAITLLLSWINAILDGLQYIHDLYAFCFGFTTDTSFTVI